MAEFAKQISDLPLYQELDRAAGRDSIGVTDIDLLKALVNHVADTVGPLLTQIPVTFRQYTVHDIRHCRNVIARMGDIVPPETLKKLNALEITFLLLSALLHDVGMVVTDHEKAETLGSESFRRFRAEGHADRNKAVEEAREAGNEPRARAIEDALLAEYYRRLHPERVQKFLDRHLAGRLRHQEIDFAEDLARLCESHAWGVEESNDARRPKKAVAQLETDLLIDGVRVNLQYLAGILRLADILDFDRSRTPLAVFQHVDFSEPKSWAEWNKHLQVKGREITPMQVRFDIPCTQPIFYVAVHEFLDWIDEELRQCRYLIESQPRATADRYKLLLPHVVDRRRVRMENPSYIAGAFRFQLEYENILTLLMDKSLYPDPSLFLRELLQNALDACRRREAIMEERHPKNIYTPRIVVWDRSNDPNDPRVVFQDNGVGMSQRIVEHYFLRVGRSYYRSPEFDAERRRLRECGKELDACSQFGIGILSCFLAGDRFDVETYQEGHDPLHIQIEGPTKYFVLRRLAQPEPSRLYQKAPPDDEDGPPGRTGTRVTVHLRSKVNFDILRTLGTFAVNVDYPIIVYGSKRRKPHKIPALRWEKPARVKDCLFHIDSTWRTAPALESVLVPSLIPFSQWDFSRHLRGSSWFWFLKDPEGHPTPRSGFLKVGTRLGLAGIAKFVAQLDSLNDNAERETREIISYPEWIQKLEDGETESPDEDDLRVYWLGLSNEDRDRVREITARRSRVLDRGGRLRPWADRPEDAEALLRGSIEWADQPLELDSIATFSSLSDPSAWADHSSEETSSLFMHLDSRSSTENLIALHSILLPSGIVEWSPLDVTSRRVGLLPFFGGVRIDVRGMQAPRPAAHRLFVPKEEIREFRQQFLHAALLYGVTLVARQGRSTPWRRWYCELLNAAALLGLNKTAFASAFGREVESACGLAIKRGDETVYLSREELLDLASGPVHVARRGCAEEQDLILRDPVNDLLCEIGEIGWKERVEVDLSGFPIVRAKGLKGRRRPKR